MDYPGFGLSEGLHGFISSFDQLVDDVIEHYLKVKENPHLRSLPSFLYGESMGGAVALKVHLKQPSAWSGAILVAPMYKIADEMAPSWALTRILIGVGKLLPKHKLVPQNNLADMAFRDSKKKEQSISATGQCTSKYPPNFFLKLVSLPLLILHGKADIVTDPSVSNLLYEKASSSDKKVILYDDAWHCLLEGEPDEMIVKVFTDIITWLDEHSR
ncbi:hypothetical protein Leryth_018533 [Lithospermum erythrorhizon]|nr:hypothetical protein Leryth_018533 [Lithospermum erythrorhizon]